MRWQIRANTYIHTYIHTYTRDNYSCACAPRVNKNHADKVAIYSGISGIRSTDKLYIYIHGTVPFTTVVHLLWGYLGTIIGGIHCTAKAQHRHTMLRSGK